MEAVCLDTGSIFEFSAPRVADSYVTIAPMHRHSVWGVAAFLAGCGAHIDGGSLTDAASGDAAEDAATAADAAVDAPAPLGLWSMPEKVAQAATASDEDDVTLSSDALELIFAVTTGDGKDLYQMSRLSKTSEWTAPAKLSFDGDTTSEEAPRFSADDQTLYFASDRGGNGTLDIYTSTRSPSAPTNPAAWSNPAPLGAVSTKGLVEKWFMPCADNRYVMAQGMPGGGTDLVEGTLDADAAKPIVELNSPDNDTGPFLTRDCLTIYFASNRSGTTRIYTSQRRAVTDPWDRPTVVRDFAISGSIDNEEDPWLSPDGRTFAFAGAKDIYLSTR